MVDLNSDLGEGFGVYTFRTDEQIIPYISSANVACGWHAGDPLVMEQTVAFAKQNAAAIGAHPGLPDLLGFGRRNMVLSPGEAKAYVKYQIGALQAFTSAAQVPLQHVKPHGALYNMACRDARLADEICAAVAEIDSNLILLGPSGSCLVQAAEAHGLRAASEVFADRAYNDDGTLVSRSLPGAVIHDADLAVNRVIRMIKEGVVDTITGKTIPISAQSVCVHGDNPQALALVQKLCGALEEQGIGIAPLRELF